MASNYNNWVRELNSMRWRLEDAYEALRRAAPHIMPYIGSGVEQIVPIHLVEAWRLDTIQSAYLRLKQNDPILIYPLIMAHKDGGRALLFILNHISEDLLVKREYFAISEYKRRYGLHERHNINK